MILKRPDGKRVLIEVNPRIYIGEAIRYPFEVRFCPPGKIKYLEVYDRMEYQSLPYDRRAEFVMKKQLEHVTQEEIYQAKLLSWQNMKPTL